MKVQHLCRQRKHHGNHQRKQQINQHEEDSPTSLALCCRASPPIDSVIHLRTDVTLEDSTLEFLLCSTAEDPLSYYRTHQNPTGDAKWMMDD